MPDLITFHGQIKKVETMQHGSLRLRLDTQEDFSPVSAAAIIALKDAYGSWGFKTGGLLIQPEDVPDFEPEFKDDKSPAQRLRAVLFVLHKQKGIVESFNSWYISRMQEYISNIKEQLDPEGI